MKIFVKIRKKIAVYLLEKRIEDISRKVQLFDLNQAKKIGILYEVTNENTYNSVNNIVNNLFENKKSIKVLGFVNDKLMPNYITPRVTSDYFTTKDINWLYMPSNSFVDSFIQYEFDILINLSLKENYYLDYVSALSRSKLKIGNGNNDISYYDLIIKMKNNFTFTEYVKEINHYLSVLNQ